MKHFNKAVGNSKIYCITARYIVYIVYRFHANVEGQLRLLGQIGKKFWLYPNTKIWYQTPLPKQKKYRTPFSWIDLNFLWFDDAGISYFHFYFLFRTYGKKGHLDENNIRHCCSNFLKVPCWKLLDHSYA